MSAENQNIRILLVESWCQQNFNIYFEIINSVVILKIFTKFESLGCFQSSQGILVSFLPSSQSLKKKIARLRQAVWIFQLSFLIDN